MKPDLVVTIQPGDMVFTQPAPLDLPNTAGWAPGTFMDLWSINPTTGRFDNVGIGQVSADGKVIHDISGGVHNSSWHFYSHKGDDPKDPNQDNNNNGCSTKPDQAPSASEINLDTGEVTEDHTLSAYQSLGSSHALTLHYDSLSAYPQQIVRFGYADVNPNIFSVPDALKLVGRMTVDLNGVSWTVPGFATPGQYGLLGGERFWSIAPGSGTLDAPFQVDMTAQPTGVYSFSLSTGLLGFTGTRFIGSSTTQSGLLISVNAMNSPYGSGWGIAGLQRLVLGTAGLLLTDGNGTSLAFRPSVSASLTTPGPFISPPGDFSTLVRKSDGTYQRTETDGTVSAFDAKGLLTSVTDRNGNVTSYTYVQAGPTAGALETITDPVGLVTRLAYDANGHLSNITDPANRVTQFSVDPNGNLVRITDPDGATNGYGYDAQHHLTSHTDPRQNTGYDFYDANGRATGAILADGSKVYVAVDQVKNLPNYAKSIQPTGAPLANRGGQVVSYTDGNGHTFTDTLDAVGQRVTRVDGVGATPGIQRDGNNLVTQVTDARGNATNYSYDAKGNVTLVKDQVSTSVVAPGHLLAFYPFSGDANDASGKNNNGVVTGATLATGYDGQGYAFSGTGDFIRLPLNINPSAHPTLTMGAWVKVNSATPIRQVISQDNGGYDRSLGIDNRGGGTGWSAFAGSGSVLGYQPVTAGQWTFVAVVYDQTTASVTLYVDNKALQTTGTLGEGNNYTLIGSNPAFGQYFSGTIDNVFFYDAALSAGEIASIRSGGAAAILGTGGGKQYTYESKFNRLTSVTDELGHQTLYDIDPANGNIRSVTQVVGAVGGTDDVVTRYTYTSRGSVDTETDPLSHVTKYDYNALGRLTRVTFAVGTPDEAYRTYEYDAAGNITAVTDERLKRTEYAYDAMNRVTKVTEPDPDGAGPLFSPVTVSTYDKAGNLETQTDALLHLTRYDYDPMNRLVKTTDAALGETTQKYDNAGNLIEVSDPLKHTTTYKYDARNRRIESTDPNLAKTSFTYDLDDNLVTVTDPVGNTTTDAFDSRNRVISHGTSGGNLYQNGFEGTVGPEWSNKTVDTTPTGRKFLGQFGNNTVRLSLGSLPAHDSLTVSFDLYILRSWDGNNNPGPDVWSLTVAGGSQLLKTTFSSSTNPTYYQAYPGTYPGANNAPNTGAVEVNTLGYLYGGSPLNAVYHLSFTFPHNASSVAFDFAGAGLQGLSDESWGLDNVRVDTGQAQAFVYDKADNLTSKIDRNGRQTLYAYDDLNRLNSESWIGASNVIRYGYDVASNLISIADQASALAYTYDNRNRVKTVDNQGTPGVPRVQLTYGYDAAGNVTSVADAINGQSSGLNQYTLDALNRVTQVTQSGNRVQNKRVDFAYNTLGQFSSIRRYSDLAGSSLVAGSTYGYDSLNRITSLSHKNAAGTVLDFNGIGYDAASRITSLSDTDGSTVYGYDQASQLTSADHTGSPAPDETYAYDANGNRTSSSLHGSGYQTGRDNELLSDGTYNYIYDKEGNLSARTTIATGDVRTFAWDYRNRLVSVTDKTKTGTLTQTVVYTYDALDRRISEAVTVGVNTTTTYFAYDGSDVLLAFQKASGAGFPSLSERNLFGPAVDQILAQEDGAGKVAWMMTDYLGTVRDVITNTAAVANHIIYDSYGNVISQTNLAAMPRYQFTGREFDGATGLYYYRARSYDQTTGRFTQPDPATVADNINFIYANNNPIINIDPLGLSPIKIIKLCAKGYKVIRDATFADAVKAARQGEDVLASSHKEAKQIARAASEGKRPIRDPAHKPGEGQLPHYHPNPRTGSHVFYSIASAVTVSHYASCQNCIEAYLTEAADLFNPLSAPKDIIDLFGE